MAEELADTHAAEQPEVEVVSGAEIPEKAAEKPVTIREALTASIKEVSEKEERARDIASGKFIPKDKAPEKVEAKESAGSTAAVPARGATASTAKNWWAASRLEPGIQGLFQQFTAGPSHQTGCCQAGRRSFQWLQGLFGKDQAIRRFRSGTSTKSRQISAIWREK